MRSIVQHAYSSVIALTYLALVVSGVFGWLHPVRSYEQLTSALVIGWSVLQMTAVIPLAGILLRRPVLEWRGLILPTAGVLCYVAVSWTAVVIEAPSHGARAADVTGLALLLIARFLVLWRQVLDAEAVETALREGAA